ncbi:hypothetical protein [Flavobacterium beibuense]|nr:hypothetical protein [Flavobacterium beibuense]
MKNFISKLNWRLILVHVLAACFFVYSAHSLSYFYDIEMVRMTLDKTLDSMEHIISPVRIAYATLFISVSGYIGVVVGTIASLLLCKKYKWFKGNSIVVLLISSLFYKFDIIEWLFINSVFYFPARLFHHFEAKLITHSVVLFMFGVLCLFNKRIIRFIETGRFINSQVTEPVS